MLCAWVPLYGTVIPLHLNANKNKLAVMLLLEVAVIWPDVMGDETSRTEQCHFIHASYEEDMVIFDFAVVR